MIHSLRLLLVQLSDSLLMLLYGFATQQTGGRQLRVRMLRRGFVLHWLVLRHSLPALVSMNTRWLKCWLQVRN